MNISPVLSFLLTCSDEEIHALLTVRSMNDHGKRMKLGPMIELKARHEMGLEVNRSLPASSDSPMLDAFQTKRVSYSGKKMGAPVNPDSYASMLGTLLESGPKTYDEIKSHILERKEGSTIEKVYSNFNQFRQKLKNKGISLLFDEETKKFSLSNQGK